MKCATLLMREGKPGGGKGPLIADNRSQCPSTSNMQTLFTTGGVATTEELDADIASMEHIVRRLTPLECERLQGLPDGYTVVHFTDEMLTDELVDEFIAIKLKWDIMTAKANTAVKPKSRDSMRSWLKGISEDPPDAPRYKACGNGWACNQPRWIVMNLLNTQYPGWDDIPLEVAIADGFPLDANFGFPVAEGVSHTLKHGTAPGHKNGVVQTGFRVGAEFSNSMVSDNPDSGFPQADISPTLDTTVPNPNKRQGGLAIVCKAHGINPQNGSLMFPCSREVVQTLAVCHGGGVLQQRKRMTGGINDATTTCVKPFEHQKDQEGEVAE
jgi:hypothetical protein